MLFWITSILTLLTAVADIIHYRRLRHKTTPVRRRLFAVMAVATDALPFTIAIVGTLMRDNTTAFMTFAMWMFWAWMVTVLPRMACYFFRLIRLPRVGVAVGACVALFFIWGATLGRTTIRVNHVEIRSDRIPAGFDGFRIAQFTDTHLGTVVSPERELGRIVDSINAQRPHLIIFTGDLVNIRHTELDARAVRLLSGLRAPYGVVSVTGNHDIGAYIKDSVALPFEENLAQVIARQREMGWRVLEDTTVYLHRKGDSISLTGISFDPEFRHIRHVQDLPQIDTKAIYRDTPDSMYNVTAVHIPQLWSQITDAGYGDLTLSGHVHSMQMKIRLFGRAFSPAQWLYTRWSGRYDEEGRTLYINDGTGYVAYPMRLGAYPEITLITLKRCE
ncbi:metallophosphoesterase [uncultured Alistipes sp.]|jgi:predicted phosphohydrolases|uniref:metallophosphoesterase n=1 Tax=uncultured Alistipes sp. TaxID=538949 RepID=UPI0025CC57A5|nr:metallophosphoesterase [uncultured Alistipes sp.]